jgi:hypothetical protein
LSALEHNTCVSCPAELPTEAWTLERAGLYFAKCQDCGTSMQLWEYQEGRCLADPGAKPAPVPKDAPEDEKPDSGPARAPRRAKQKQKRKRNEPNPMQAALFGSGK